MVDKGEPIERDSCVVSFYRFYCFPSTRHRFASLSHPRYHNCVTKYASGYDSEMDGRRGRKTSIGKEIIQGRRIGIDRALRIAGHPIIRRLNIAGENT